MESIYEYSNTMLSVDKEYLKSQNILEEDFLGVVSQKGNRVHIQDNYFNRMLLEYKPPYTWHLNEVLPQGLTSYQQVDVVKSMCLGTFCNFNRMGYGKTVETIAHMKALQQRRVLIVAPKAVHNQWKQEIAKWYPEISEYTHVVTSAQQLQKMFNAVAFNVARCLILNYEKLLQSPILSQLRSHTWDMVVFDEAHYLKNRRSKRTQAAQLIPAMNICILTGTPVMAHLDDLWAMLNVLGWKYSGQHYWPWVEKFCEVKDDFFGKKIVGPTRNIRDLENLRRYIDMIAIHNPDLHLTQGKRSKTITLEMPKEQRIFYNKIKKLVLEELPDNITIANGAVKVIRLRQVTSCPQILDKYAKPGIKFEWIKNFIESTDEQVLILTQFADTVKLLSIYLDCSSAMHYGSMSSKSKDIELKRFKEKHAQVLIATMQSIGTGVDGLQNVCRLGIIVDADYSPEINRQAEDRLDRLGQQSMVCWYYLECDKTFDRRVCKINDCKDKSIKELLKSE